MSCKGLKDEELKKCQEKAKAKKYKKGDAKKNTNVDLNKITFKNDAAKKMLDIQKRKARDAARPDSGDNQPTKAKILAFGGNKLGGSRMKLHRKRNNKSTR